MALADILLKLKQQKSEPKPEIAKPQEPQEKIYELSVCDQIDSMIKSEKVVEPFTADTSVRVSGLGFLCTREEVLRARYGIKRVERIAGKLQRIFDVGHAFHSMLQNKYFADSGLLWGDWKCLHCHKEYKSMKKPKCECGSERFEYVELELKSDNLKLTGHPDGILEKDGDRWLLELKTINSMGFELVKRTMKPKPEHLVQVNFYMAFLKIRQCMFVYFNKDTSEWVQMHEVFKKDVVMDVVTNLQYMRKAIADKNEPLPERKMCKDKNCYRAKSCPVSAMCFQN